MESHGFEAGHVQLEPGDSLILYTDGVSDALNQQNVPFAIEGIRRAVLPETSQKLDACRPESLGRNVIEAVRRHASGRAPNDDIALVCFGRLDSASGSSTLPEGEMIPADLPV
jgi:serine phosphatase RsbU (regulator of sigma subunit)